MPKEDEWISVKEMMPIFAGYAVLATLENVYGQRKVEKIFTGYGYGKQWHCNNGRSCRKRTKESRKDAEKA